MRLTAILKVLLYAAALTGIIVLAQQILILQQYENAIMLFNNLQDNYPEKLFAGLSGIALLFSLIAVSLFSCEGKRFFRTYKSVESDLLDTNKKFAIQFYQALIKFRLNNGRYAYRKHIINKFSFKYDYHNNVLTWIDETLAQFDKKHIPENFMLSAITSGYIGQINTDAHYASGLPASNQKPGTALIFHKCATGIQIWSYTSTNPLVEIQKNSVKLHPAHRHPNYLSAILTGLTYKHNTPVQIELRFLSSRNKSKHAQHSETLAKSRMMLLNKWLRQPSISYSRERYLDGIEVTELLGTDSIFKTPLCQKLEQLVYRKVDAFYPRSKLPIANPDIALDAVVLCKGVGILLVIEKHEQGDITYSGDPEWFRYHNGSAYSLNNPCIQSQLAKSSLSNLLATHHLTKWPVISVVVFSKELVTLNPSFGKTRTQCDVIRLNQMEKWIDSLEKDASTVFMQEDILRFNKVMNTGMTSSKIINEELFNPA